MTFPLETERLILRHFCDEDLEPFLAYRNDPDVQKYQGWQLPYPRKVAVSFVESMKTATPGQEGGWFQMALERKQDHILIGDLGFRPMPGSPKQAYLGFTLSRLFWGQGYAGEATRALIDYLFAERGMHRIVAYCDVDNVNSYRLLERLGFRREAHHLESFWLGAGWGDEYVYALLERDWPPHVSER